MYRYALPFCAAALLVTACGDKTEANGPVAATVNGEVISVRQVEAELKAAGAADPDDPAVRQSALRQMVVRKLLAQSARSEKLDKAPDVALLKAADIETFEAGLARTALLAKLGAPAAADVESYVQAHPEMFAQRTAYLVDSLHLASLPSPALAKALEPVDAFDDIEHILKIQGVVYRRSVEELDSLRMDPRLSLQIAKLPAGQSFVLPGRPGPSINRIRASKVQPVMGQAAMNYAREILRRQRAAEAFDMKVRALTEASKGKIVYGEGFSPARK